VVYVERVIVVGGELKACPSIQSDGVHSVSGSMLSACVVRRCELFDEHVEALLRKPLGPV
jgi:hypothetical protein